MWKSSEKETIISLKMLKYYPSIILYLDHRTGQNFIIPEMADSSLDLSELAKAAKKKLQAVSIHYCEVYLGIWYGFSIFCGVVNARHSLIVVSVNSCRTTYLKN